MARLTRWLSRPHSRTSARPALHVERLESRDVPAVITVTSFADNTTADGLVTLREAIQAAETDTSVDGSTAGSGADTIRFAPAMFNRTFQLSTVGSSTFGPTAFAVTTAVTIDALTGYPGSGSGVTFARDAAVSDLRLFRVGSGGSLTLQGVTLSSGAALGGNGANGNAGGGGGAGMGGAIFNQGTLSISQATFLGNTATGGFSGTGSGSGVTGGSGGGPNGGTAGTPNAGSGGFGGGGGGGGSGAGLGGSGGFGGGGGGRGDFQGGLGGFGSGGFGGGGAGGPFAISGGGGAGMGGAVFNHGGTVTITNSTFTGNTATGGAGSNPGVNDGQGLGGAVFGRNGSVTILNSTLTANTANNGGAQVYVLGDAAAVTAAVNNTILGGTSTAVTDFVAGTNAGGSTSTSGVGNLIRTHTGFTGTIVSTADPLLSALASNGGPTLTMAINAGSPASNAGSNAGATGLTTDQRGAGFNRFEGGTVDIGAYEFDAIPAVSTVTGPTTGSYRAGQNLDFTVTFSETVTVTGTPRIALTVGSTAVNASYLSGTGTSALTFRYTVQAGDTDADGIASASPIDLNGGTIRDATANNATLTFTPPNTTGVRVDTTAPAVTSVTRASANPTNASSVQYTVTFSEPVTGVDASDFTLATTGLTAASVSGVSGSGTTYTVTVTGVSGTGTLRLDVNAAAAADAAGNTNTGFTAGETYTVDTVAPTAPVVTSPASATTANAAAFDIQGTAEADALVRVYSDLNNNGVIDGSDAVVGSLQLTGGATAFNIPVALTQDAANDFVVRAIDAVGNASALADVPTITEDSTAPVAPTVTPPANGAYRAGTHLDFVLNFPETVTVTGTPRIALTVGGATRHVSYLAGSGTSGLTFRYTVQAAETDADGVQLGTTLDLNGGTVLDNASNAASTVVPATPTSGVTVDTTAPTVTLTSATAYRTNANPIRATATFSEDVTGFTAADLTPNRATVTNFVAVDARTYTFDLIPVGIGSARVDVAAGAATDAAGNPLAAAARLSHIYDNTRATPTVALADGQTAFTSGSSVRFAVTFGEPVSGFTAADVTVGGTAGATQVSVTGSDLSYVVTVGGMTRAGTVSVAVADAAGTDAAGNTSTASAVSPEVRFTTMPTTVLAATAGTGANGTQVRVIDPATGQPTRTIDPFPGYGGAVDTATADVTGDGIADIVVGAGAGGAPHVKVFDGATGAEVRSFLAFGAGFTGGVDVATADVTGDGVADIVVGAGAGGAPHVKVFDGVTGEVVTSFFAYSPGFLGGVNLATGDVNGDGRADIVTAPAAGGAPHVKAFDGTDLRVLHSFFAYDSLFVGGVNVAVGDTNGDGHADIITGAGAGGASHVKVFDGATAAERASFFAYDPGFTGGVDVAAADTNGDGLADIVTGAGAGGAPHVKVFSGTTFAELDGFLAADAGFLGGVRVG